MPPSLPSSCRLQTNSLFVDCIDDLLGCATVKLEEEELHRGTMWQEAIVKTAWRSRSIRCSPLFRNRMRLQTHFSRDWTDSVCVCVSLHAMFYHRQSTDQMCESYNTSVSGRVLNSCQKILHFFPFFFKCRDTQRHLPPCATPPWSQTAAAAAKKMHHSLDITPTEGKSMCNATKLTGALRGKK